MRVAHALLAVALLAGASATVRSQHASSPWYVVIVHPDNPTSKVSRRFLADAYLKRKTRWNDGVAIEPVDLDVRSRVRRAFSEHVLARPVAAVRSYWQQVIFSGRGVPPVELDAEADIMAFVIRHRGGVGYVSSSADLGPAKVLKVR